MSLIAEFSLKIPLMINKIISRGVNTIIAETINTDAILQIIGLSSYGSKIIK